MPTQPDLDCAVAREEALGAINRREEAVTNARGKGFGVSRSVHEKMQNVPPECLDGLGDIDRAMDDLRKQIEDIAHRGAGDGPYVGGESCDDGGSRFRAVGNDNESMAARAAELARRLEQLESDLDKAIADCGRRKPKQERAGVDTL